MTLSDDELITLAAEFRAGVIGQKSGDEMGLVICPTLAGLLTGYGVACEVHSTALQVKGEEGLREHYWIALEDGRVLDPTLDQFADWFSVPAEAVYLGPPIDPIH